MDFSFTEDQEALRQLARKIFDDHCTHERLKAIEATPDWFDRDAVGGARQGEPARRRAAGGRRRQRARLRRAVHPARGGRPRGGAGAGVADAGARRAADRPVRLRRRSASAACRASSAGDVDPQRRAGRDRLRRAGHGHRHGAARRRPAGGSTARRPACRPRISPRASWCRRAPATARSASSWSTRSGAGVALERQITTNGEPQFDMTLVRRDGRRRRRARRSRRRRRDRRLDAAARRRRPLRHGAGVADRALRMTAEYTTNRKQFGKPLATFQAVAQRAADAFIWVEGMRWTTWQAAWRLAEGQPAHDDVAVAKYWAGEGGHFVTYAAQHLHGGIGLDVDYPRAPLLPVVEADRAVARLGDAAPGAPRCGHGGRRPPQAAMMQAVSG